MASATQEAESLLQQGEAEQALVIIDRQPEQTSADANWLFLRARTLAALDKPAAAEQAYRRLLEQQPQMIEAYNNLAALLILQGRLDDASQLLEQALTETDPAYATVYRNLQTVNEEISRHSYAKALRMDVPSQPVALKVIEPDTATLKEAVRNWARAWSDQDVAEYLAFYASDFEPGDGLSRQAWERQNRLRPGRPQWIRIELDKLTIVEQSSRLAVVEVTLGYESDSNSDVARKQLVLSRDTAGWRIVRENSL
ncbi:MAG: tetratricopeptide repeat protein [Thiohalophilus sp.]